jgi:hypothetical protein
MDRDLDGTFGVLEIFDSTGGTDAIDYSVTNQDRTVVDQSEVFESRASAYTFGPAQSQQLPGPAEQD